MGDSRKWSQLPGGDAGLTDALSARKGVFSNHPAMSPKYDTSNTDRSLESMARMFVSFPSTEKIDAWQSNRGIQSNLHNSIAVTGNGSLLVGQGNTGGSGYIDFLLQSAQENLQEKFQVVDVLSDNYVSYFFGQQPPIFSYAGVLLNSLQDDWRIKMHQLYETLLRGTKLARYKVVVSLAYDSVIVTGAMISMSQVLGAQNELAVPFNFQLLVKRFDLITGTNASSSGSKATKLQTYPYLITPSSFVSQGTASVRSTIYIADQAKFTNNKKRAKASEQSTKTTSYGPTNETKPDVDYAQQSQQNSSAVDEVVPQQSSVDTADDFAAAMNPQSQATE